MWILFGVLLIGGTVFGQAKAVPADVEINFGSIERKVYVSSQSSPIESPLIFKGQLHLFPHDEYGCTMTSSSFKFPRALVVKRGLCSFSTKLKHAKEYGAKAVIIVNTIEGLYNISTRQLNDPCSLDCGEHPAPSLATCQQKCQFCAPNGHLDSQSYCCVDDSLVSISIPATNPVPVFFASIRDSKVLLDHARSADNDIQISVREYSEFDPSLGFLLCYAMAVLMLSSYYVVMVRGESQQHPHHEAIQAEKREIEFLTIHSSCVFLLMSSVVLMLLFVLIGIWPTLVVTIIQVMFAISASLSLSQIMLHMFPRLGARLVLVLSFGLAGLNFVFRHHAWAWMGNNVLAAAVVCLFLEQVKLPNLKVGAVLLSCFFVYDIFMVFVTPSLFGKSVMLEVATAGSRDLQRVVNHECVRTAEERLPMLFSCPRMDFWGGYSLLGLGDVVLPGLLVVLALRLDVYKFVRNRTVFPFQRMSFGYWLPVCLSYLVGLMLAFAANIKHWTFNGVPGQPALMYLVPLTLGTFSFLVFWRHDWGVVWDKNILETNEEVVENAQV